MAGVLCSQAAQASVAPMSLLASLATTEAGPERKLRHLDGLNGASLASRGSLAASAAARNPPLSMASLAGRHVIQPVVAPAVALGSSARIAIASQWRPVR